MVIYKHSRILNVPIKFAYDWCTDFSPEDAEIVGAKFPRIVLEKNSKRAVYASYKQGNDGRPKLAVRLVSLNPKNYSWHLDYFAEEDLEEGDYKLTKRGKEKTKLSLTLNNKWKNWRGPTRKEFDISTKKTWDKYAPALENDYRDSKETNRK